MLSYRKPYLWNYGSVINLDDVVALPATETASMVANNVANLVAVSTATAISLSTATDVSLSTATAVSASTVTDTLSQIPVVFYSNAITNPALLSSISTICTVPLGGAQSSINCLCNATFTLTLASSDVTTSNNVAYRLISIPSESVFVNIATFNYTNTRGTDGKTFGNYMQVTTQAYIQDISKTDSIVLQAACLEGNDLFVVHTADISVVAYPVINSLTPVDGPQTIPATYN